LDLSYRNVKLVRGKDPTIGSPGSPLAVPPLFSEPYDVLEFRLELELDSRSPDREFSQGSGVRLESWGSYNLGLGTPELSFFRYGARPGAFWDISGVNHVLSFSVFAEAVSELGGEELPLSERVALGGSRPLQGFTEGRFRGDSALAYGIHYSWPVLFFLDGVLFTELGGAFNGFFEDFSHDRMAGDFGLGLRTSFSREFSYQFLVAFGTNQTALWDDTDAGLEVDNTRVVAGVSGAF
jgi:outer membrane protein assembly factor BamA